MFDRKRRQMRIGHEIASCLSVYEQLMQQRPMSLPRMKEDRAPLPQDTGHDTGCFLNRKRSPQYPGVSPDAYERKQSHPGKADLLGAGQHALQPEGGAVVILCAGVECIEEQVAVYKYHL